ncbi:MAG: beta-lactamase family protein [Candidatus Eremiobacteraeota bacterium]|nr:beta-lactamase family protein [Candidatus Eremiobacteraeota bacterium]MBV8281222.1 beta-lactamase family protein [Candidatus Eremiobacteraeota bacterium]
MDFETAAQYSDRQQSHALAISQSGSIVFERYAEGYSREKPHALYSGTKSFWGVTALKAQEDGLLSLDEPVAKTFDSWLDDERKARVTIRELLQLTSGFGFGGLGSAVPTFEKALAMPLKNEPGRVFTYGGIPLQVFGAVLQRKLTSSELTPHDYLEARVLDPIGMRVASWRKLADGSQPLPTGAFVAASEWLKYGAYVCNAADLQPCFDGSSINPKYGLGFWLAPSFEPAYGKIAYASGAAGQVMYIIPSQKTVVVRFGASKSFNHQTFLMRLLGAATSARKRSR